MHHVLPGTSRVDEHVRHGGKAVVQEMLLEGRQLQLVRNAVQLRRLDQPGTPVPEIQGRDQILCAALPRQISARKLSAAKGG